MRKLLISGQRCLSGTTTIEYAIIAGIMAVAIVAGLDGAGSALSNIFDFAAVAFE